MSTAFEDRTQRCQASLRAADADGLVVFPSSNLYYLSGFAADPSERHLLLIVPAEGDPIVVAGELRGEQLREATWIPDVRTYVDGEDPREALAAATVDAGLAGGRVLVDDRLWAVFFQDLRAALPGATFGLASEVLAALRRRKDERELEAMRAAADVADRVSETVRALGEGALGMTEADLAREIDDRLREAGTDGPSFETIVGSGPNGAMPHHSHGDREIAAGDPVVLDFGCFLDAYASDQTRTVVFGGDPPEGFEPAFDAVLEAHHAGVDAVGPGVPAEAVDRAAREVVEDAGFGDAFIHRTGHGVGLEVHEPPYIVTGNERPLEPGEVFSVEPGVYLPDRFGVRVEDLVVVTDDGAERLNDSPRTWRAGGEDGSG